MTNSSTHSKAPQIKRQSPPQQPTSPLHSLQQALQQLRLNQMLQQWQTLEQQAMQEQWSYAQFLLALCELEVDCRWARRLQRALSEAQLPTGKTFATFDWTQLPKLNPAPIQQLVADDGWLNRAENLLLFGPSGVGKTHLATAVAYQMIILGKRVKFLPALTLVQQLQQAKLQLQLPALLKKLDAFDLLLVDDIGYVRKSEAETAVLFELIAHRYERKSLLITANQPFSQWEQIFPDSMMTVAAVDRLIHHALIIELQAQSYRQQAARTRQKHTPESPPTS